MQSRTAEASSIAIDRRRPRVVGYQERRPEGRVCVRIQRVPRIETNRKRTTANQRVIVMPVGILPRGCWRGQGRWVTSSGGGIRVCAGRSGRTNSGSGEQRALRVLGSVSTASSATRSSNPRETSRRTKRSRSLASCGRRPLSASCARWSSSSSSSSVSAESTMSGAMPFSASSRAMRRRPYPPPMRVRTHAAANRRSSTSSTSRKRSTMGVTTSSGYPLSKRRCRSSWHERSR